MLRLQRVTKGFRARSGDVRALGPIDLDVAEGELVCLVGPSGCGKSTLLALVAGFERPDEGTVEIDGRPVGPPGLDRSVMFQEGALFPWLTARGNVEFPLESLGQSRAERTKRATELLKMVHLDEFAEARIHELSGGMKQRVALARALAAHPRVLLMDEPFGALDAQTREHLYAQVQEIRRDSRQTVLFVTHNVREAACLGDRIVLLSARPGRIIGDIAVPIRRPRTMNMAEVASIAAEAAASLRAEFEASERTIESKRESKRESRT